MTLRNQISTIVACIALHTPLYANSPFYGTFELGNSTSNFGNIEASAPLNNTTTSDVIDDKDNSTYAGIGLGYDWQNTSLRSEIQYNKYGSQEFIDDMLFNGVGAERTTVKVKQEALMFNLLYDFKITSSNFVPYVGGGVGISKFKVSATQVDNPPQVGRLANFAENSDTNFAWNLVVGANYNLTTTTTIGLGYRYTDLGKVATDDNCVSSNAHICDQNETHSAKLDSNLFFVKVNYFFE